MSSDPAARSVVFRAVGRAIRRAVGPARRCSTGVRRGTAATVDLDLATSASTRRELLDAAGRDGDAIVLDVGRVLVVAALIRDLVALAERAGHTGRPVDVVGAPPWLVDLVADLDMPPVRFAEGVAAAVAGLRAGPR